MTVNVLDLFDAECALADARDAETAARDRRDRLSGRALTARAGASAGIAYGEAARDYLAAVDTRRAAEARLEALQAEAGGP